MKLTVPWSGDIARTRKKGGLNFLHIMVTDGPFGETKEAIGGYWFIVAGSLEEAAKIAAGNPCLNSACSMKSGPSIRNGLAPSR